MSRMEMQGGKKAQQQLDTLRRILTSGLLQYFELAVDGGAHVGDWTALMAERFKEVHAFEPQRDVFAKLTSRFGSNDDVVKLHNRALFNAHCRVTIRMPPNKGASSSAYVRPDEDGPVKAITLDSLGLRRCDFLKLDLEGAELLALIGAEHTIHKYSPVVCVELYGHAKRYGFSDDDVRRWLLNRGYTEIFQAPPDVVFARE